MPKSKQKMASTPWIELPRDITANILHRLGAIEILESAERVCTTWRSVCLDPSMWRVIDMKNSGDLNDLTYDIEIMCQHAVDRSRGELIDINIEFFGNDELLDYIAQRSSHLKRLSLANIYSISGQLGIYEYPFEGDGGGLSRAIKKLPQLEEVHLINMTNIGARDVEDIGYSCPLLKSFTFNGIWDTYSDFDSWDGYSDSDSWDSYLDEEEPYANEVALAIAENMPNLRHLGLIGNEMKNEGLQAILDACQLLESLDLRVCKNLDLRGDLGKRCSEQIKCLKRPSDSIDDYDWLADDADEDQCDSTSPSWIELPRDVTANILHRLGAIEILESAQKVCTTWHSVCLDPAMWRVIDMRNPGDLFSMPYNLEIMCRHAVDRSQGQLIDINIPYFGTDQLLDYITQRSCHLRRLLLANCNVSGIYKDGDENVDGCGGLSKAVKKLPDLEELHLIYMGEIGVKDVKYIGISRPELKSFSFNDVWYSSWYADPNKERPEANEVALAVAENMPNLRHLALIGNEMKNDGLQAILNGCPHLESLDVRVCKNLDLGGDLGKRCSQQLKCLRRPSDSTRDYGLLMTRKSYQHKYP